MIAKKFISDESGVTVAVETILLFSISVIFLGVIFFSFQDMNQRQNKILMEEELLTVGNSIAEQMSDMTVEARASRFGRTTITSEFWMPSTIADSAYRVTLTNGRIFLESTSSPYIGVEVPINTDMNLAENSVLYSNDERHILVYNSSSGKIYFKDGGVLPPADLNPPTISIDAPPEGASINKYTYINTTPGDDTGAIARVEFYVKGVHDEDGVYRYTAGPPWKWLWNTREEDDGDYTVTAVAYDPAGNNMSASRNYTVYNPYNDPPVINIISPSDGESTDFKRPVIKAKITDDKELDFSRFILSINDTVMTKNITFDNDTLKPAKITTLTYNISKDMAEGHYWVNLSATDKNTTPLTTIANWSFDITPITDDALPQAKLISPTGNTILYPGQPITVTYEASDLLDSGLDNLTVYVRNGTGAVYSHYEEISKYPNIVYEINPQETWTFNYTYIAGRNYSYNVTVFDRSGKNAIVSLGNLTVAAGLVGQFEVDASANYTTGPSGGNYYLKNILVRDNVSDGFFPIIDKITVSWTAAAGSEKIKNISFNGADYWTGNKGSGTQNDITDYTTQNIFEPMSMGFNFNIKGRTFTIVFLLKDSSSRTVVVNVPS